MESAFLQAVASLVISEINSLLDELPHRINGVVSLNQFLWRGVEVKRVEPLMEDAVGIDGASSERRVTEQKSAINFQAVPSVFFRRGSGHFDESFNDVGEEAGLAGQGRKQFCESLAHSQPRDKDSSGILGFSFIRWEAFAVILNVLRYPP